MKDTHVLAAACGLALIAIVCVFIGYVTDTLPQHKQRVIKTSSPDTTNPLVVKKKNCHCCKVSAEDIQKHLKKLVNARKQSKANLTLRSTLSGELP